VVGLLGLLRFKWTYLIVGVILGGIGLFTFLSAHPSKAVEIDGTESKYIEVTKSGNYDRNELNLQGDSNTYTLDKNTFHPTLPDEVYKGGKMQIWIDEGTTTIIAITLYDQDDKNPTKYTTAVYDNPATETSTSQGAGIFLGVLGAVFLVVFGLWFVLGSRRPAGMTAAGGPIMGMPLAVPQSPSQPGSSPGVSPDGKWYWDGQQWRNVSADGRFRWDGTQWVEMGTTYAARGAPPPPAATPTS